MLYNNEAELMYPPLSGLRGLVGLVGLSGLGCAGKDDCGCRCDSELKKVGLNGLGELRGLGRLGDIPWSCSTLGIFCEDPIIQTKNDNSNYGPALTQENRDRATALAVSTVEADMISNPCSYSESNGMSEFDKMFKCGEFNWPLITMIAIGGVILLKKI
jgi:hypothetical protein